MKNSIVLNNKKNKKLTLYDITKGIIFKSVLDDVLYIKISQKPFHLSREKRTYQCVDLQNGTEVTVNSDIEIELPKQIIINM